MTQSGRVALLATSLLVSPELECCRAVGLMTGNQGESMKTQYALALAVATGFGLGAAAVQGLHAQAKPPGFVVTEADITNQDGFLKEFSPAAQKALGDSGSKTVVRGGKTVAIDGAPPKSRIVINSFASLEAAVTAYNSPAYKEARTIGNKYGTFRIYAVEGLAQ